MPDAVTTEHVRHAAMLARLGLTDDRARALTNDLNTILEHMAVLSRVDTTGVPEASGIGNVAMPLRADEGPPVPIAGTLAAFAPEMRDGFFIVPRLSTHETTESEG